MTKIYYDTEFIDGPRVELISIGMVSETGPEYYAVSSEFSIKALCRDAFVREHVWPHLPQVRGDVRMQVMRRHRSGSLNSLVRLHTALFDRHDPAVKTRAQIAREVHDFVTGVTTPSLWAWGSARDHVLLTQLYGGMIATPKSIPWYTNELQQEIDRAGEVVIPPQKEGLHHALHDARHERDIAAYLGLGR